MRWPPFQSRRRTGPMSCNEVHRLVQKYLDDQLDDAQAARLASHLADCRRCGLDADTYRRIKRALADGRGALPPDALDRLQTFAEAVARGEHDHA